MRFDAMKFSERLAETRQDKGITQKIMAEKMSISQSAYSKIELGKVGVTLDQLFTLADILEVTPQYLISIYPDEYSDSILVDLEKLIDKYRK